MLDLLQKIATAEGAHISQDALALITRAAEGSARDATSLLDQAISHGAGETTAVQVRAMLGLADRGRVMDLFELVMKGDAGGALTEMGAQYADGADPMAVLRDLAEITHWVSIVKITPEAAEDPTVSPDERARGQSLAGRLPMRVITRMWQMLLKALDEVTSAPNAKMAAEMAIIRLTHVADLPSPDELVKKLQDTPPPPSGSSAPTPSRPGAAPSANAGTPPQQPPAPPAGNGGPVTTARGEALALSQEQALAHYPSFEHVLELIRANRDVKLLVEVETTLRLAAYKPGRIEFVPTEAAPRDLAQRLGSRLKAWTGTRWTVSVVNDGGGQTIAELRNAQEERLLQTAQEHPLVQAVIKEFPNAYITSIRTPDAIAAEAETAALPPVEDEWDPFEEK